MSVILSSPSPAGYNPITGLIVMMVAFGAMISEVTRPRGSGKEPRVQGVRWGPNNKKKMRSVTQVLEHRAALEKTKVKKKKSTLSGTLENGDSHGAEWVMGKNSTALGGSLL